MKKKLIFYVMLSILLIISSAVHADWVAKGPAGTTAGSLYCSQEDPNIVFVGTNGGVYKTDDSGETWVYKGLRFRDIAGVGARTTCGPKIYAGGWDQLFQSSDGGDTWSVRSTAPDDISSLVVTPSCIGYVGTDDGVFASNGNKGLRGIDISALAVDSGNTVYAATEEYGCYKTTDNGATWTPISSGITYLNINALKVDGNDLMFAGSMGGGVYFSNNSGESWTPKNNGLPNVSGLYLVFALEKDSTENLYAGVMTNLVPLTGAVYKSTDNGDSWISTDGAINGFHAGSMCVTLNNKLFVGTTHGIFRTDDFGTSWVDMTSKISAMEFSNSFVMDASGTVFVASDGGGIYKSTDKGKTWVPTGTGDPADANDLLIDDHGNMYATAGDVFGVAKSIDKGDTWTQASSGLPTFSFYGIDVYEEGYCFAMDGNGTIYIGLDNGEVYRTGNHAETWSPASPLPLSGDPQDIVALIGATESTIYVATEEGGGIFKSSNGGTNWEMKNNGLPDSPDIIENSFFIDETTGDIYVGLWNGGLYKTSDGGNNWVEVQTSAPGCDVRSVTMDQNGNLYAVICSGAVYVSRDKGTSWIDVSTGLIPWDNVEGIRVSSVFAAGDALLLATESSGMYKAAAFTDVPGSHWAYNYVEAIYDEGITTGCTFDGLFRAYCPPNPVSRQAMSAFIIRAVEGEPPSDYCESGSPFTDVPTTSQFCKYIKRMHELGITTGCTATEYCPFNPVSRQAMAAFIIRALEGEPPADYCDSGSPFTDVPMTSQFCKYIKRFSELGITTGCTATEYCPFNNVTRGAMAAFLSRAFLGMP